jgi:transcriptional regulator with XRE-family HTH domain
VLPFGETVLLWRLERGLTQDGLARAAKLSRPNLSAIERGEREVTLKTLRSLAVALGVRPGVLADGCSPHANPVALSRTRLERVAAAAAGHATLDDAYENALAANLRQALGKSRAGRSGDRAYLRLKSMASPETIASLLARVAGQPGRN